MPQIENSLLFAFAGLMILWRSTRTSCACITYPTVLHEMNLHLQGCREQCYDGASSMAGCRQRVAYQIFDEESRALFTRYYGHSLNLAMCDTLNKLKIGS